MFGYISVDMPNLYMKDLALYKACYCGLCKSLAKTTGTLSRLTLSYDLSFLSVFYHNILGVDVEIKKERCVMHTIKKREICKNDFLFERIAAANVILAYNKLCDDIDDENKGKVKKSFLTRAYKKAAKKEPQINQAAKKMRIGLDKTEKEKIASPDIAADHFAEMTREFSKIILGDKYTDKIGEISYYIGKWIYLIDALDDFDKDKKKNNYNPFVLSCDCDSKEKFIESKRSELELLFGTVLNEIATLSREIDYKFNHDLIDNVLRRGLAKKTKEVFTAGEKKCKDKK